MQYVGWCHQIFSALCMSKIEKLLHLNILFVECVIKIYNIIIDDFRAVAHVEHIKKYCIAFKVSREGFNSCSFRGVINVLIKCPKPLRS